MQSLFFLNTYHSHLSFLLPVQEANKPPDSWFELKVNTHVYITGLPEDVTVDEVVSNFVTDLTEGILLFVPVYL